MDSVFVQSPLSSCDLVKPLKSSDEPYHKEEDHESPFEAGYLAFVHTFQDIYVAFKLFWRYLVTVESLVVCAISVGTTLFYCYYRYSGHALAANLSWQFFAFAVVFPLTMNMNEAFKRREQALGQFAVLKAQVVTIYFAHRDWDWATKQATHGGRAALAKGHVDQVRSILREMSNAMAELLSCPIVSRGRHQATAAGGRKLAKVQAAKRLLNGRVFLAFNQMSAACEELKTAGLPGNEAARLRQYNTNMWAAWESLRILKRYRTPLTMRTFSRVYIWAHPFVMGPYYAYIAGAGAVQGTNTAFACSLAAVTSLAVCALLNARYAMEDPFDDRHSPDAVHAGKDFAELHRMLGATAEGAPLFDDARMQPSVRTEESRLASLIVHNCCFAGPAAPPAAPPPAHRKEEAAAGGVGGKKLGAGGGGGGGGGGVGPADTAAVLQPLPLSSTVGTAAAGGEGAVVAGGAAEAGGLIAERAAGSGGGAEEAPRPPAQGKK